MDSNKSSQFVQNLSKLEEASELLQRKFAPIVGSKPQLDFEPEPQVDDVNSSDVTPVRESSGAKKILKRAMGDDMKYRLNVDDWDTFAERMELHFIINDTPSEKWVAEMLTRVNEDAFKLIRNLALPRKLKELSFEELVQLVSNHLNSQQAERFKFSNARQMRYESVNQFAARIKKLSLNCNFDNQEESLKDQFVNGVSSDEIRAECFRKTDLTFQAAVEMANSREQARAQAKYNLLTMLLVVFAVFVFILIRPLFPLGEPKIEEG